MRSSANRDLRPAMIPWIIALALMLGTNAFAPNFGAIEKPELSKEATLTQAGDEVQLAGRSWTPAQKLPALLSTYSGVSARRCFRLRVAHASEHRHQPSRRGAVRGRAPPVAPLA